MHGPLNSGIDISQLSNLGSVTLGDVELDHLSNNSGNGYHDRASGLFVKISGLPAVSQAFVPTYLDSPPIGTCTVIRAKAPSDVFFNNLINNGNVTLLDAGSNFTITGSSARMNVQLTSGNPVVLSPSGTFLAPGDYTIAGSGGKDVGAFTAHITIPAAPTLRSPASTSGVPLLEQTA